MSKKIAIFGGGITGLTIAHELNKNGYDIEIYELSSNIGGMAKSKRDNLYISNEHSFRTITNSYYNTIDILKQIPLINNNKLNVYDNLIFGYYEIQIFNYDDNKNLPFLSYLDGVYMIYLYIKTKLSNKRNAKIYNTKIKPLLKKKLTKNGYDYIIKLMSIIGPMNINTASVGNFFDNLNLLQNIQTYFLKNKKSLFYSSFFNKPTSEAWFDHWTSYLQNKGVKIYLNSKLTKINTNNNEIIYCEVNNIPIKADYYVLSMSPFNTEEVFINSNLHKLTPMYKNLNVIHNQISFRIGFNINLQVDKFKSIFILYDSPYGIMINQQDSLWDKNVKLDNNNSIKALWSGICTESITNGILYNKTLTMNNKSQLYDEILFQLFKSRKFVEYFQNINPLFSVDNIIYFELYDDWIHYNGVLKSINPKWTDTAFNHEYKPEHKTIYNNMYVSGAHCKTSTDSWLMEAAIESGKIVSNEILKKNNKSDVFLHDHKYKTFIINLLSLFDDIIYYIFDEYICILDIFILIILFALLYLLYDKYITNT